MRCSRRRDTAPYIGSQNTRLVPLERNKSQAFRSVIRQLPVRHCALDCHWDDNTQKAVSQLRRTKEWSATIGAGDGGLYFQYLIVLSTILGFVEALGRVRVARRDRVTAREFTKLLKTGFRAARHTTGGSKRRPPENGLYYMASPPRPRCRRPARLRNSSTNSLISARCSGVS